MSMSFETRPIAYFMLQTKPFGKVLEISLIEEIVVSINELLIGFAFLG